MNNSGGRTLSSDRIRRRRSQYTLEQNIFESANQTSTRWYCYLCQMYLYAAKSRGTLAAWLDVMETGFISFLGGSHATGPGWVTRGSLALYQETAIHAQPSVLSRYLYCSAQVVSLVRMRMNLLIPMVRLLFVRKPSRLGL